MLSLFALTACVDDYPITTPASSTVAGTAAKGPYQTGSTVEAYALVNGVRGATPVATGTVTDAEGSYSLEIPDTATGPFEIVVKGTYIDETTGAISTSNEETSLIIADATNVPASLSVNPIASIQSAIVKQKLAAGGDVNVANEIKAAGKLALQSLGIPTADAAGNDIDPSQINILDSALDPAIAAAAIRASATVAQLAKTGTTAAAFATAMANDVVAGNAPGTSLSGGTTTLTNANNAVSTINVVANLNAGLAAGGSTTAQITSTTDAAVQTNATTSGAAVTTLKGFALDSNSFVIDTQVATVAADGTVTVAATINKTNVVLLLPIIELPAGADRTFNSTVAFEFDTPDLADTRRISGTINPVKITVTAGRVTAVVVPANATLAWKGTTAAGTNVAGNSTNAVLNSVISVNGSNVMVNANSLLNTITAKINNADLNVLNTAGTFSYAIGFDFNVGTAAALNAGIAKLFPVSTNANVSGRAIHGQITTF